VLFLLKGISQFFNLIGNFKEDRSVVLYTIFGDVIHVTTRVLEKEPIGCELTVQSDLPIAAAIHKALSRHNTVSFFPFIQNASQSHGV